MTTELVGQWGLYPWFEEDGRDLIHPADLESFRKLIPNGKVFCCSGREGDFIRLQYGQSFYRVRPRLFAPQRTPMHVFGQSVAVKTTTGIISGVIVDIIWHFKQNRPYYHIVANGKRVSKRYWDEAFL